MMSDGTPFEVLLQQAADLKTAQMKEQTKWFDRQPLWMQHSLFLSQVYENIIY